MPDPLPTAEGKTVGGWGERQKVLSGTDDSTFLAG